MANNINNNNPFPGQLLHSVQLYWQTIGNTLQEVRFNLLNQLSEEFLSNLNNLIQLAHDNSDLYGDYLQNNRDQNMLNNYNNNELLFYHHLSELINQNNIFTHTLQNLVRIELQIGTRYFFQFLDAIGVQ
jgi:hypothetical protein